MVLALSSQQLSDISAHAEQTYPEECCGLLVGELNPPSGEAAKQLVEIVSLGNEWTPDVLPAAASKEQSFTKARRYWIDPQDMLRVQKQAREQGLNIIGIYHSHPDHVAVPSECDRVLAWPAYAYVIVSVCEGKAVDVQNWALDSEHQFHPEAMRVSSSTQDRMAKARMPVSA
ncbi:MAG: M67 family metallopeptidase [Cyanobacteria bacterium J06598_1]